MEKAKGGDSKAQLVLAKKLYAHECSDGDDSYVKWIELAAGNGELEAFEALGSFYWKGDGLPRDLGKARGNLDLAIQRGSTRAKKYLDCINKVEILQQEAQEEKPEAWFEYGSFLADIYNNICVRNGTAAVPWLQKAADRGNAAALREIGRLNLAGIGMPINKSEALEYFERAAVKNDREAMIFLGREYSIDNLPEQAFKWNLEAAKRGAGVAQAQVGEALLEGKGVKKNEAEGVKWLKMAVENEEGIAEFALAEALLKGTGTDKDCKQALKWYKKAAESDLFMQGEAMRKVAWIHSVDPYGKSESLISTGCNDYDPVESVSWYNKALSCKNCLFANKEQVEASLANVYINERVDTQKGLQILKKLAGVSDNGAMYATQIGFHYYQGHIGPTDYKEAISWFTKGAMDGDFSAQTFLSSLYAMGKGVKKDLVTAYAWSSIAHANVGSGANEDIVDFEKDMKPKQIDQAQQKAKKIWKEIETRKNKKRVAVTKE